MYKEAALRLINLFFFLGKEMLRASREKVKPGKREGPNHWLTITLRFVPRFFLIFSSLSFLLCFISLLTLTINREGKNREIKRVMEKIGLKTSKIIRIQVFFWRYFFILSPIISCFLFLTNFIYLYISMVLISWTVSKSQQAPPSLSPSPQKLKN